jgi:hypothetical protein
MRQAWRQGVWLGSLVRRSARYPVAVAAPALPSTIILSRGKTYRSDHCTTGLGRNGCAPIGSTGINGWSNSGVLPTGEIQVPKDRDVVLGTKGALRQ